jgi:hypothetical protein
VIGYISGVAYVMVSYTIRFVLYAVIYTAAWVVIVGMVLDDKSERFLKRESPKAENMPEKSDDTEFQWVRQ